MTEMKIQKDDNGGWDISGNLQKRWLRKWGIIGVLLGGALMTGSNLITSKMVNDVSFAAKQAPINKQDISRLDTRVERLDNEVGAMRNELRSEIAALRKSVDSLRDILLEEKK